MRTNRKWAGALFLALLVVLPAAGCGGSGGGGGGGDGGGGGADPCAITWSGNSQVIPVGGSFYLTGLVGGQLAKFSFARVIDPSGLERLYEYYVDPSVGDLELFSHLMPSHISYGDDPFEPYMQLDKAGTWRIETSTWSPGCNDQKRTTYVTVGNGPPPPPPSCTFEVGLGADGSQCEYAMWHFEAKISGHWLDLMNNLAERALVRNARLCFGATVDNLFDVVDLDPSNGFCRCYKPNHGFLWVQAKAEVFCDGRWTLVSGPPELISDSITKPF